MDDKEWMNRLRKEYYDVGYKDGSELAQAEIDTTYGKAFVHGKKYGEETMKAEIDQLVNMLERVMLDEDVDFDDAMALIAKHRGE